MRAAERTYSGLPVASILVMPKSSAMKSGSWRICPDWPSAGACTARSSQKLPAASASISSSGNRLDTRLRLIGRVSLQIGADGAFERALGAQDEFAHFAHGAMPASRARHVMGAALQRLRCRGYGRGKTAAGDQRQVEQVVTHIAGLPGGETHLRQQRGVGTALVLRPLVEVGDAEAGRAQFDRARVPGRDQCDLHAVLPEHLDAKAVLDVERLQFLAALGVIEGAVGHDAVDVENHQLQALGALERAVQALALRRAVQTTALQCVIHSGSDD